MLWRKKEGGYQNIGTLISHGVEIKGEIVSQDSIRVDGKIEGKLHIKGDLVVGEKGKVKGEVKVGSIILAGTLEGDVSADDRVEVTATGAIIGEVSCKTLAIEEGGVLEGNTKMQKDKEDKEKNNKSRRK